MLLRSEMEHGTNSTSSELDERYKRLAIAGMVVIPVLIVLLTYPFLRVAALLLLLLYRRRRRNPVTPIAVTLKKPEARGSSEMIIDEDSLGFSKSKELPTKLEISGLTEHDAGT